MAIEKMKMLNIVLPKQDVYPVIKEISLHERVEMINAHKAIDETSFLLTATVENAEVIQELADVGTYTMPTDAVALHDRVDRMLAGTNWKPNLDYSSLDYWLYLPGKHTVPRTSLLHPCQSKALMLIVPRSSCFQNK